ncbi:B3 domain-containing protein Os01g0234100-like [Papaver somniferum]|uniref:B3 domain-containing protein Os01g0234100-like n=1 Tax=Papaver somniferum TaxID=3469 RepID=UPI000E6FBEA5|nr:B3 domain-containing protein Os01g0234100-like [Papaver somniferum]
MGEATLSAKARAEEIQSTLDPSIPSLIKVMLESHVVKGFWLGVPTKFCEAFMPKVRIKMTLVDEKGKNYKLNYIPEKTGLSGGWKGFSVDHKLRIGDAVLFQLVDLMTFKVVIVKGNGVADTDGGQDIDDGLTLLQLKARAQRRTPGDACKELKRETKTVAKRQRVGAAGKNLKPEEKPAEKRRRRAPSSVIHDENRSQKQPDDDNGDAVDSVVGDFESFTKIVKDLVGDSKLPEDVLEKYYKLCCTHNSFLHANLLPGCNSNLVAGMIIATVEIVHGIRSCKLRDTLNGEVAVWKNKLEAFEKLGMSVDFVFPRLNQLQKLSEKALIRHQYQQMYPE